MKSLILLYHGLESPDEPFQTDCDADRSVVVGIDDFRDQLRRLASIGKTVVPLETMLDAQPEETGDDHVVLTFDDGHRSNWSLGLPALAEAGVSATFYIVAGRVDNDPQTVTAAQLRELAASNMTIGSHTMTHRFLPQLSAEEVRSELADSRARLEDLLGQPVLDLAIPGGHCNDAIVDQARECGYRSVATCKIGYFAAGDDPFRIRRAEIRRGLDLEAFRRTFAQSKLWQLQLLETAKSCVRSVFGLTAYTSIRSWAHRYLDLKR